MITDGEKMKDVNVDRILNCKPEEVERYFNEKSHYWYYKEPKYKWCELEK